MPSAGRQPGPGAGGGRGRGGGGGGSGLGATAQELGQLKPKISILFLAPHVCELFASHLTSQPEVRPPQNLPGKVDRLPQY